MTTANAPTGHTTKKGRSPSYPSLSLDVAVRRAAELWNAEKRNSAPISAIQAHWNYKPNTGPANLAVAALKKYGLLRDSGSGANRIAALTDLGFEVVHQPDVEARASAIRKAALMPPIHKALWDKYRETGLPSDPTLRYELLTNRAFTETGADEFIAQFRKTIAFADLASDPGADDPTEEPPSGVDVDMVFTDTVLGEPAREPRYLRVESKRQRPSEGSGKMLTIPVPVMDGEPVVIEGQFPISEAAWDHFILVLQTMKPGLISKAQDDEQE